MPSTKQCSKCGKSFECCADGSGCWCEQYSVSTENLAELKDNFADCLCPECLAGYTSANEPINQSTN